MKCQLLFFTLLVCSQVDLGAQKLWSYQECVEYAIENNLILKSFEFDTRKQEKNYTDAWGDFLPSVNLNVGYNINQGRATDPNTNQIIDADAFFGNSYGLGSSIQIFNGFVLQNQLKYEKYRLMALEENYKKQLNDITYLVLTAYVQHLNNTGLAEMQKEQLSFSERELYRITKNVDLGLASGSDKYEAEAEVATDEFLYIQLQNRAYSSQINLKKLLNLPVDSALFLSSIEPENGSFISGRLETFDHNTLPEVKSTLANLEAVIYRLKMSRSTITPSLVAYANWGSGFYETRVDSEGKVIPFNSQIDLNTSINFGLSLNIPVFNKLNRITNIQLTKIDQEKAENELRIVLRDVEYDLNEAYQDYMGAIAENNAAQKKEQSRILAFEVSEKKREKGMISIMDFNEAKNNLAVAKAESLRTRLQSFLKERSINFYLTGSFLE